jgi:hypothetical protein
MLQADDGSNTFLRHSGKHLPDYTATHVTTTVFIKRPILSQRAFGRITLGIAQCAILAAS